MRLVVVVAVAIGAGQKCKKSLDAQYHRYGFHCHTGSLTRQKPAPLPRSVTLEATGPPEVVFDWTTDRCEDLDIPDAPARAFRDADSNVQLISTHYINRRFIGSDLDRLRHPCDVIMDSGYNPDTAAFDDHEWITATWTPDGRTVYALIHDEYDGWEWPGQCSGEWLNCWYNAITLAVSTDGGRTYIDHAAPKLVATLPYRYVPDDGPMLMYNPSNIVRNPKDGYFYAFVLRNIRNVPGTCLIRTKSLADPSSWRAWSGGTRFDTRFVDPYGPNPDPETHVCRDVPGITQLYAPTLTYNSVARQWLLVGSRGGASYSLSKDLRTWTTPLPIRGLAAGSGEGCEQELTVYFALIDPSSSSRNFETSGKTAFLYYTQFHTPCELGGLDRDLMRVPIAIRP